MKKKGLGRGLGALIKDDPIALTAAESAAPQRIPPDLIQASRWQPRHSFDKDALAELTQSVREHGVLQP